MERHLYHATNALNYISILESGLRPGIDGIVYLAETPEDAIKFVIVKGISRILVVEIRVPLELSNTIIETFDHSEAFFKCRAFGSIVPIELDRIVDYYMFDFDTEI